ncbi:MAG: 2-phospho-L-lactate transferase, partial [Baekduiaceae bacterium]
VGGRPLQDLAADFLAHTGHAANAAGIAALYDGVLDGIVTDEPWAGALPALQCATMLGDPAERRRVADATLRFAESLR